MSVTSDVAICKKMEAGRPAWRATNNTPTNKCTYYNTIHNTYETATCFGIGLPYSVRFKTKECMPNTLI